MGGGREGAEQRDKTQKETAPYGHVTRVRVQ